MTRARRHWTGRTHLRETLCCEYNLIWSYPRPHVSYLGVNHSQVFRVRVAVPLLPGPDKHHQLNMGEIWEETYVYFEAL